MSTSEEERFVRTALAQVEKADRISQIKRIVLSVIAIPAVYVVINSEPTEPGKPLIVMIVVGLMLAVCTAKLTALINKNTLTVLRAIADIDRSK
jgi:hypothetical protein